MDKFTAALINWLKQPTTITGFAGLFMSVSQYLGHNINLVAFAGGVGTSLVLIAMPQHTGASTPLSRLIQDTVQAVVTHKVNAALVSTVLADVASVGAAVAATPTQTAPGEAPAPGAVVVVGVAGPQGATGPAGPAGQSGHA